MATRTGSFGTGGRETPSGTYGIGVTLGTYEYPTAIEFVPINANWYCPVSAGAAIRLSLTGNGNSVLFANFGIPQGQSSGNMGPWSISGGNVLSGATLSIEMLAGNSATLYNSVNVKITTSTRTFTITWKQDDGTVINTSTVDGGQVPSHTNPAKASNQYYVYTFAGWSPALSAATSDATYTATYTFTKKTYSVTTATDPNGKGTVTSPTNGNREWGATISCAQTPADGYQFDQWVLSNGGAVTNNSFVMPAENVILTAKYALIHTLVWTNPSISISQQDYELTVTMGGYATDNYGEAITYYLEQDGTRVGAFDGTSMTLTLTDEQLETDIQYVIVAESSLIAVGASAIYAAVSVHKTVSYYDGNGWVECVASVFDGNEWVEVEPYYFDGTVWVPCSRT